MLLEIGLELVAVKVDFPAVQLLRSWRTRQPHQQRKGLRGNQSDLGSIAGRSQQFAGLLRGIRTGSKAGLERPQVPLIAFHFFFLNRTNSTIQTNRQSPAVKLFIGFFPQSLNYRSQSRIMDSCIHNILGLKRGAIQWGHFIKEPSI